MGLRGPFAKLIGRQPSPWRPPSYRRAQLAKSAAELVKSEAEVRRAADRVRRHRERRAAGRVLLPIVVDEVELLETLAQARLLDPLIDHDRESLARGVERLLKLLAREA